RSFPSGGCWGRYVADPSSQLLSWWCLSTRRCDIAADIADQDAPVLELPAIVGAHLFVWRRAAAARAQPSFCRPHRAVTARRSRLVSWSCRAARADRPARATDQPMA